MNLSFSVQPKPRIAIFCVGNRLLLDEGIGPAVYDEIIKRFDIPDDVGIYDVGCMSLDMLSYVEACDVLITVDAVDGTDEAPGTVFRFKPEDIAVRSNVSSSLHDLRLSDLFATAQLLGYTAEGVCFGMQVENRSPLEAVVGLTPRVHAALPLLVDAVAAELAHRNTPFIDKKTNIPYTAPTS